MIFHFIEFFRFSPSLIDEQASYLEKYPIVDHEFKNYTEEQLKLFKKKGVYPYHFTSSFESQCYATFNIRRILQRALWNKYR